MFVQHTYLIALNITVAINWYKFKLCDTYTKKTHTSSLLQPTQPLHWTEQNFTNSRSCHWKETPSRANSNSTSLKELPNNIKSENTYREKEVRAANIHHSILHVTNLIKINFDHPNKNEWSRLTHLTNLSP